MIVAHHHALHEQSRLERIRSAREQLHLLVLDVHEGIGAALALREQARPTVDVEGARASAGDDAGLMTCRRDGIEHPLEMLELFAVHARPIGRPRDVLHLPE